MTSHRLFGRLLGLSLLLAGGSAPALTVTQTTSDNGYPAHLVQWTDSAGQPRSAMMVDQNSNGAGPYAGYLRQYTYQVNGQPRVCTGTESPSNGGTLEFSGEGFVQNHTADGNDYSSGDGAGTPGTTAVTLQGSSHALITFDMPGYMINGQTVPTTVQWFFADGRDHPVFALSQDARATPGNLGADSRSPYSDMAYDGDGIDALVGGFAYGDTYQFITLASNPEEVTPKTGWDDTQSNSIPYAMQWANPATVDAEMGHVATLPITISDQGGDTETDAADGNLFDPRTQQMLAGPLPPANTYAYQIIGYSFTNDTDPTDSKRLSWGANFGRVGGFDNYGDTSLDPKQYSRHSDDPINMPLAGSRADGLLAAYSTFVVLGTHGGSFANGVVNSEVVDMQSTEGTNFIASTGTVATSGPAGVGNAANATISYTPAGYNPTYAAWEITASSGTVKATLTPPAHGLAQAVFIVDGYTAAGVPTVTITAANGSALDSYVTLDTAGQRVWVTTKGAVDTNGITLEVTPSDTPPPSGHPAFFDGEQFVGNGTYFLQFDNGNVFGYYGYLDDPSYIYHDDLGYEYVFDAADGKNGVYLYDFTSSTFWYTSPTFPFPYLYDFTLNTVLYYYPDPNDPQHYNTDGVRYFYDFDNGQIITK